MSFNFLSPVEDLVLAHNNLQNEGSLGRFINIHSEQNGFPSLDSIKIALIGVPENRNQKNYTGKSVNLAPIRMAIYSLYKGNWDTPIADLGNINLGETIEDTYFALKTILNILLKKEIIPIVLGGGQDITYACYRAFDHVKTMINLVNIDPCFDLGDNTIILNNKSFLGRIILEEPFNLFNYTNIGYQTYYNSQEEIDLMKKLYFDAYRLGELDSQPELIEVLLRDAHLVSLDLNSIKANERGLQSPYPHGFSSKEMCSLSRYAGISNSVKIFGVYETSLKTNELEAMVVAQMIWYFMEGVNCRVLEKEMLDSSGFKKYIVPTEEHNLVFYKNITSSRWWIQIPVLNPNHTKLKNDALLACTEKEYKEAVKGIIPKRWFKAIMKDGL